MIVITDKNKVINKRAPYLAGTRISAIVLFSSDFSNIHEQMVNYANKNIFTKMSKHPTIELERNITDFLTKNEIANILNGCDIDYKSLLKRYIEHIKVEEGTDFIPPSYNGHGINLKEWEELGKLSKG